MLLHNNNNYHNNMQYGMWFYLSISWRRMESEMEGNYYRE